MWAECTLRGIPNDYRFTFDYLKKHCHELVILNLGSSHGDNCINPDYFHHPAFNAGISGQTLEYDYAFFNTFYDSLDRLQVLILPISYFSLNCQELCYKSTRKIQDEGEKNFIYGENIKALYYKLYCPFSNHPIHRHFLFIRTLPFSNVRSALLGNVRKRLLGNPKTNGIGMAANGSTMLYGKFDPREQQKHIQESIVVDKRRSSALPTRNNERVEAMVKQCKKRNIQVMLLSTPVADVYREGCNPMQWKYVQEKCEQWEREYDNVTYINMFASPRFTYSDFSDCHHLNKDGAKKLTLILDSVIENSLIPQSQGTTYED